MIPDPTVKTVETGLKTPDNEWVQIDVRQNISQRNLTFESVVYMLSCLCRLSITLLSNFNTIKESLLYIFINCLFSKSCKVKQKNTFSPYEHLFLHMYK